jgi:hypothetical protein
MGVQMARSLTPQERRRAVVLANGFRACQWLL